MRILLIFLLLFSRSSNAQTMAEWAQNINHPSLGSFLEVPDELNLGSLQIQPNGEARQLLAGDQPCGILLSGGHFSFNLSDRFSAEVAKRNLKSMKGSILSGNLRKAIIWTFDDLGTKPDASTAATPIDWLNILIGHAQFDLPALDLVAAQKQNTAGVVYAILQVEKAFGPKYYLYRRDPAKDRLEEFYALDQYTRNTSVREISGDLFPCRLAAQPIQRQWWDRFPAPTVAVYENINIDNPAGDLVHITTTTKLQVMKDGVNIWRANLLNNRWDNRYQARFNRVVAITVNGQKADYLHQSHELIVALDRIYKADEMLTITTQTSGEIAIHPDGNQYWNLGTSPWYPQPDPNGELAVLDMTVRAPKPLIPFASGSRISLEDQGSHWLLKTQSKNPIQFPVATAGRWQIFEETQGEQTSRVGSYVIARKKGASRLLKNFFGASEYFGNLFGTPYPFKDLAILELNEWAMGQAPANIIFVSKESFDSKGSLLNQLFSQGVNERFIHEVAHAWWGHVIKMDSEEEQWLSESFAEYSAALCLQAGYGGRRGDAEFKKMVKHWRGNSKKIKAGGSIYLANYLAFYGDIDSTDRLFLLYNKGPLVLHALRQELAKKFGKEQGDRFFIGAFRAFIANFQFKWGATHHFIGILNQITKQNWQPFFEDYVFGSKLPQVKI